MKGLQILPRNLLFTIEFVFILLLSQNVNAQDPYWHPVYKNYTTVDGLSSMEVYYSVQDNDGYIWFASDRGVTRYNGEEFETFTTDDGLESNVVFKIEIDDKGRIWFLSNVPRLCYWEDGEIKSYKYNDKLEESLDVKSITCYTSWDFDNDEVMISLFRYSPIHIDAAGNLSDPSSGIEIEKSQSKKIIICESKDKLMSTINYTPNLHFKGELSSLERNRWISQIYSFELNLRHKKMFTDWTFKMAYLCAGKLRSAIYVTHGKDIHLYWKGGESFWEYDKEIVSVSKVGNSLWVGLKSGGVSELRLVGGKLIEVSHLFIDKTITSVYKSDANHLWITSLNDGVFKIETLNVSKLYGIPNSNQTFLTLAMSKDELFLDNEKGHVFQFNRKSREFKQLDFGNKLTANYGVIGMNESDEVFINVSDDIEHNFYKWNKNKFEAFYQGHSIRDIRRLHNGNYLLLSNGSIHIYGNQDSMKYVHSDLRSFDFLDSNRIWVASYQRLAICDIASGELSYPKEKILNQRVNDVKVIGGDTFFATNGSGLLIKNKAGIKQLTTNDGLPHNFIRKIRKGKNNDIWILGDRAVARIYWDSNGDHHIRSFEAVFMQCEKLSDLFVGDDFVYVCTNKGLLRIKNDELEMPIILPRIHLLGVTINGKSKNIFNQDLLYSQNDILINFDGVSYDNRPVKYRYRNHPNEAWSIVNEHFVRFNFLPPGDYEFELQASVNNQDWGDSEVISFSILLPFWLTWWFIMLEIAFGTILLIWFVKILLKIVEERHVEKEKMMELQQEALTQQMNPHFIFNALGSVQNSILKGDSRQANSYLVKFSRLLRSGLNASRSHLITLEEDKELMENYLAVEKTRLGDNFTFNVEVISNDENYSLHIAPFLLQPFLENSIKHGIREDHPAGHVDVIYKEKDGCVECSIEDNGIGREATRKNNIPGHMSHGTKIAFERIELFNKSRGCACEKRIEDLYDDWNTPSGTRVVFTIPIIKK